MKLKVELCLKIVVLLIEKFFNMNVAILLKAAWWPGRLAEDIDGLGGDAHWRWGWARLLLCLLLLTLEHKLLEHERRHICGTISLAVRWLSLVN